MTKGNSDTAEKQVAATNARVDQSISDALRVYEYVPQFKRLREDVLLADVWQQPELSPRDRSMVTCAILAVLGKSDELGAHLRKARDNGVTNDQIRGLVVQVAFYAGWPAGLGLGKAAIPMFLEED